MHPRRDRAQTSCRCFQGSYEHFSFRTPQRISDTDNFGQVGHFGLSTLRCASELFEGSAPLKINFEGSAPLKIHFEGSAPLQINIEGCGPLNISDAKYFDVPHKCRFFARVPRKRCTPQLPSRAYVRASVRPDSNETWYAYATK